MLAEKEEKLVGGLWYAPVYTLVGRDVFVERLYVVPEQRRKGYGEALLEELVEKEKNISEGIQLVAPESALAFYFSLGFQRIGKEHYDGRQNFSLLYVWI